MLILSGIVAAARNGTIGLRGDLPWKLPEDSKFFRDKTRGHAMIMGRKTFDSLPGNKPLPGRLHIVVSRDPNYRADGAVPAISIEAAIQEAARRTGEWGDQTFVIGGGEIYALAMPYLNKIYLTEIHRDFDGDARFPEWPREEFVETERRVRLEPIPFDFVTYERKARPPRP